MRHYKDIKGGKYLGCSIEYDAKSKEYKIYDAWGRLIGCETTQQQAKSCVREFVCNEDRVYEDYEVPASARRLPAFYKPKYLRA